MVVVDVTMHHLHQLLQHVLVLRQQVSFEDDSIVEAIYLERLVDELQTVVQIFRATHLQTAFLLAFLQQSQNGSLQGTRLVVTTIEDEGAVELVECILIAALRCADAGSLKIACVGPCLVPCGLPEEFIGLLRTLQVFQRQCKVEDGLALIGVRVTLLPNLHSFTQIRLSLIETSASQVPKTHLVQTAHIIGIATQSFLVVVEGRPRGMTVLLQVESRQIELVVGLRVLRWQGSFGGIGDGPDLVRLGVPLDSASSIPSRCGNDRQGQLIELGTLHIYRLGKNGLRRQCQHLIIVLLTIVVAQHDASLPSRCSQYLQAHATLRSRVDVHDEIPRRLLHHTQLSIGHEILRELLLLVGHEPCEVGLVLGIDPRHQLDVGAETFPDVSHGQPVGSSGFVGQITVPRASEVAVAPCPLLLSW